MKTYDYVNNALGWLCFVIAAATYLLTLEPTASFWDCPEFIAQGFKLEVGHPPGNPVFMLAARFFINLAGGSASVAAVAVNAMSALLSALTVMLLFWTVTHLTRRLVAGDDRNAELSPMKMMIVMGAGLCGALMYAWSDTFWFSAVEGEVYAFSSFCTALVFWLILKWENRADEPHSDRYLVLIAYVIGISIAVHLLNLLCIPAIVLVVYYRRWSEATVKGSLTALAISFALVALILYGLVPGFIEVSQWFELFFVNVCHMSYNMGVLIYAIILVGVFIWAIAEMYRQKRPVMMKVSFALSFLLSGIPFIGSSAWVPVIMMGALVAYLFFARRIHVRILNLALLSIFVIFIGYSSYALLLIRSSANPPMNQNEPDNVFALSSYLNREQYGDTPLLYGRTPYSTNLYQAKGGAFEAIVSEGRKQYSKVAKSSPEERDEYVMTGREQQAELTPELNMVFPRIYSGAHIAGYKGWLGLSDSEELGSPVYATLAIDENGEPLRQDYFNKPTFAQNLQYFLNYQLNHMYWRYFMWNFAGRQNDIQGNGEVNNGNWITGIPAIDNARLGDQSLLPDAMGSGNKGHNVFFAIPLLMGLFGLLWQSMLSRRGIEQFWVVCFLFFMTGIAIVLYLNQTPGQPRERDYAFAGSFYAYAIWVGMGVPAIARAITWLIAGNVKKKGKTAKVEDSPTGAYTMAGAIVGLVVGILVPLQVVSQTWDDHDRSGRYTARDFGFNYLNSLDDNAIIFTNGDNDTFPLWYAQEVEGERTDVKVVNLSYLTTPWYVNQVKHPSYNAPAINTLARPTDYAYDELQYSLIADGDSTAVEALAMLQNLYASQPNPRYGVHEVTAPLIYIPSNLDAAVASGRISAAERRAASDSITINFLTDPYIGPSRGLTLSNIISLDILATSVANGWDRPVYFASTVPEDYYMSLTPYMRSTGMAFEVGPIHNKTGATGVNTDKMYRNVTERFRWGGLDQVKSPDDIYLDETVRRMVQSTRGQLIDLAYALYAEGMDAVDSIEVTTDDAARQSLEARRDDRFKRAVTILDLMTEKLPVEIVPYTIQMGRQTGDLYVELGHLTGNNALSDKGRKLLAGEIAKYAQNVVYYQSLKPWQFETLQNVDLYIYRYYLIDLMQSYLDSGADQQSLMEIPGLNRIDFQRIQNGY